MKNPSPSLSRSRPENVPLYKLWKNVPEWGQFLWNNKFGVFTGALMFAAGVWLWKKWKGHQAQQKEFNLKIS
jgi:hypothetical protein